MPADTMAFTDASVAAMAIKARVAFSCSVALPARSAAAAATAATDDHSRTNPHHAHGCHTGYTQGSQAHPAATQAQRRVRWPTADTTGKGCGSCGRVVFGCVYVRVFV
jgi:hypothetical protein